MWSQGPDLVTVFQQQRLKLGIHMKSKTSAEASGQFSQHQRPPFSRLHPQKQLSETAGGMSDIV